MKPEEKGSTISKLIERFRVNTTQAGLENSHLNHHNFRSQSHGNDSLDLKHADIRTELDIADHYTAIQDNYLESELEISSPMPVSKISIRPRSSKGRMDTFTRADPSNVVANFRSDSLHASSDILQEWRAKRRNEILKYKYHSGPSDKIDERKQDYFQRLTNKYLPTARQLDSVVSNPITDFPTHFSLCNTSQNVTATRPILQLTSHKSRVNTRHQFQNTMDHSEVSFPAMQYSSESPLVENVKMPVLPGCKTNRDDDNSASKPVCILTNHSVQTTSTKEVLVQTTPPPSPPTRGPSPEPVQAQEQEQEQGLEESSAWSISSLTTEEESPSLSGDTIKNNLPSPEAPSVTGRERIEGVNRMEQDELLRLLVAKAAFYEHHIHNIDKLLSSSHNTS